MRPNRQTPHPHTRRPPEPTRPDPAKKPGMSLFAARAGRLRYRIR